MIFKVRWSLLGMLLAHSLQREINDLSATLAAIFWYENQTEIFAL
jgi:hypothetical protein